MTRLTKTAALAILAGAAITTTLSAAPANITNDAIPLPTENNTNPGVIQVAIILDTSNSMDGLINQAKRRLWDVAIALSDARGQAEKDGSINSEPPRLEVALYQYGNSTLPAHEGYIQRIHNFTSEIDEVAASLFALNTSGGEEYCAWAISDAVRDLDWNTSEQDGPVYRVVFIAGNEPFTQGPVDYQKAIPTASANNIIINTIHCGQEAAGANTGWLHAAHLGGGTFANINPDNVREYIPAPQDDHIRELNLKINETYIPYGAIGKARHSVQLSLDQRSLNDNAESFQQRAVAKASGNYLNTSWDLVDAITQGTVKLEEVDTKDLPENMQSMTPEERAEHINAMTQARSDIRKQIGQLATERAAFLAEARQDQPADGLDDALITALKQQATKVGFIFQD